MVIQRLDIKIKKHDAFESDGYMYSVSEDGQTFIVAGRYYVHKFYKKTMQWDLVYNDRDFSMSIGDRRKV